MYERMLNKRETPAFEDLIRHSGESGGLWITFEGFLTEAYEAVRFIRFPYGNHYGWSAKYSQKNKHICDVFAEKDAFTAHFQVSSEAINTIHDSMDAYAKRIWANRYPCGSGGWLHYRVINGEQLRGLMEIIKVKMKGRGLRAVR